MRTDKKAIIVSTIITFVLVIILATFAMPKLNLGGFLNLDADTQTAQQEQQFTLTDWAIDDNTVYINDERVYLAATPHTLIGSGWVVYNVTSKAYTGDIDLTIGVDTPLLKPTKLQRYNPTQEQRQESYTCHYFTNYTLDPKHFYCYYELQDQNNNTYYQHIFNHSFDTANQDTNTAHWTETYTHLWKDVNKDINRKVYKFRDVDTWYVLKDVPVVAEQDYSFRVYLEQPINAKVSPQKYWFAVKPSSLTIRESIQQDKLYALDPWTDTTGLIAWYDHENASASESTFLADVSGQGNNLSLDNIDGSEFETGKIGFGVHWDGSTEYATGDLGKPTDYTINFWYNMDDMGNAGLGMAKSDASNGNIWAFMARGDGSDDTEFWTSDGAAAGQQDVETDGWDGGHGPTTGTWMMMTGGANSSHIWTAYNGSIISRTALVTSNGGTAYNFSIGTLGEYTGGTYWWNGLTDEVAVWNRSLTDQEVLSLWNGGSGLTFSADSIEVNVTFPLGSPTEYNDSQSQLNYTITSAVEDKCWYTTNNGTTNSSTVTAGNNFTGLSGTPGNNYWTVWCNTTSGTEAQDNVTWYFNDTISVNVTYPLNTTYNESVTQLNYTLDTNNEDFCWYTTDNGTSNSSAVTAGNNFTLSSQPEYNTWTVWCNTSYGSEAQDNVTFFVNKSVGAILITPPSAASYNYTTILFEYNATTRNTNVTNVTHFIWFSNGTNFLTNMTDFGTLGQNTTQEMSSTHSGLIDDTYTWTAKSCGLDVLCTMATNFTFETHTVAPDVVINYPKGTLGAVLNGATLDLNWTISEAGENLTSHISNCSYTYNGVTEYLNNITHCISTNETSFTYVGGVNSISFTVVDEFNLSTTNTSSWIVSLSEYNQTWSNDTVEGAEEDFTIFVAVDPSLEIDAATLIHNGTSYVGTTTNTVGTQIYKAERTITIPSVDSNQNVSFYWRFTLNDSTTVDGLTKNQTIANLEAGNCTSFNGSVLYNFTVVDEEFQTELNETYENLSTEADLEIYSFDRTILIANFSTTWNETNPFAICLSANLSDTTQYSADLQVRYESTEYAAEFYNIQNGTLQNSTLPQNITLYDLDLDDSTEFLITYKGDNFLPLENALITITRKYVGEGIFKTVEIPVTDSDGQAVAHLDLDGVIYTIIVTQYGQVLATFSNVAVVCQDESIGDCKINLNAVASSDDFPDWYQAGGIASSTSFDESTRTITTTFTTTDGEIAQVQLNATKFDRFGNDTVCSDTLNSAAGSLSCVIPNSYGNVTVLAELIIDDEVVKQQYYSISPDTSNTLGEVRYVFMFILFLTIVLMFTGSAVGMLLGGIVGLIIAGALSLIDTGSVLSTTSAIIWFIVAIGIVIWKISQNKDGI